MQLDQEPVLQQTRKVLFLEAIFKHKCSIKESSMVFGISSATGYRWRNNWLRRNKNGFGDKRFGLRKRILRKINNAPSTQTS